MTPEQIAEELIPRNWIDLTMPPSWAHNMREKIAAAIREAEQRGAVKALKKAARSWEREAERSHTYGVANELLHYADELRERAAKIRSGSGTKSD